MKMITYKAIPLQIPEANRLTLIALGLIACNKRHEAEHPQKGTNGVAEKRDYAAALEDLLDYEAKLRKKFGVEVTREEILINREAT